MAAQPSHSDVYDVNLKTGALILGKNRLDDYAEKYLSQHYPKALLQPMPLPVEELLESSGLQVKHASLSSNADVFGCCVLVDGEVQIYDKETGQYYPRHYEAGTILIDPDSQAALSEGSRRNALMHEILHWEKDRTYFQISQARLARNGQALELIKSRSSATFFTPSEKSRKRETEIQWLEWQAHRLAPRVLMPKAMFRTKALELLESTETTSCDGLIEQLSKFFLVSRSAVKYRLLEVRLKDRISSFDDFPVVYSFIRTSEENFAAITPVDAFLLLSTNPRLQRWVEAGDFIYVDGYFVRNSTRFVRVDKDGNYKLKAAAKKDLAKCALLIQELVTKDYVGLDKDLSTLSYLEHKLGLDKRVLYFDPSQQVTSYDASDHQKAWASVARKMDSTLEEEIQIAEIIGNIRLDLCQTITALLKLKGINYPQTFNEKTGLYDALYNKIVNGKQRTMKLGTLMAIAVGLGLTSHAAQELMKKAGICLNPLGEPDRSYLTILERFPGTDLYNANCFLEARNLPLLGSKYRDF